MTWDISGYLKSGITFKGCAAVWLLI